MALTAAAIVAPLSGWTPTVRTSGEDQGRKPGPEVSDQVRVVPHGVGVQSTVLGVLAATGRNDFSTFLLANVGKDSEHPDTLAYVRSVAMPYATEHGIDRQMLDRRHRDASIETLSGRLTRPGSRSLPIPVRMSNGAPGRRSCTANFKIRVIGRWLGHHGATKDNPAVVGIGISLDQIHRANTRAWIPGRTWSTRWSASGRKPVCTCVATTAPRSSARLVSRCHRSHHAGCVGSIARPRGPTRPASIATCSHELVTQSRCSTLAASNGARIRYGSPGSTSRSPWRSTPSNSCSRWAGTTPVVSLGGP